MKISNTDGKNTTPQNFKGHRNMEHRAQAKRPFPIHKIPETERLFFLVLGNVSCGSFLPFAITPFQCNLPDIYKLSTIIKVDLHSGLLAQGKITSSIKPLIKEFSLQVPTKNTLETI